jgi:hypothetical protein
MPQTVNISVYLQALGGHFLGANAYDPANITISLKYSGGQVSIPYMITTCFTDDGNVSPYFITGASSFMPIITIPQPLPAVQTAAVNFLSPDFTTIAGKTNIALPGAIELADLEISVPTTLGKPLLYKQSVLLNPNQPEYKIIVVVPGLYLSASNLPGSISVFVKMMCGCPVTAGPPASLWPSNDFTVYADVLDDSGENTIYLLTYDIAQTGNSLFSAALLEDQKPIQSISFTAIQKSTGNYGALIQDF